MSKADANLKPTCDGMISCMKVEEVSVLSPFSRCEGSKPLLQRLVRVTWQARQQLLPQVLEFESCSGTEHWPA